MSTRAYGPLARQNYGRVAAAPRRERTPPQTSKSAPVLRIERAVLFSGRHNEEWRDKLERFARVNRQLSIKNLGGMACTYMESRDMNAMLAARYPNEFSTPQRIRDIHERFARSFKTFVDNSLKAKRESERLGDFSEVLGRGPNDPSLYIGNDPLRDIWSSASMRVKPEFKVADGHSLVLDLTDNEVLWEELERVRNYLHKDEGLNLGLLKYPKTKPHITIARTSRNLASMNLLKADELSDEIALAVPQAWHEREILQVAHAPRIAEL